MTLEYTYSSCETNYNYYYSYYTYSNLCDGSYCKIDYNCANNCVTNLCYSYNNSTYVDYNYYYYHDVSDLTWLWWVLAATSLIITILVIVCVVCIVKRRRK